MRFKELPSEVWERSKAVARATSRVTMDAWSASARFAYEQGRMKMLHARWKPVYYEDGLWDRVGGEIRRTSVVRVSIPFQLDGKQIPACRNGVILRDYESNYPQLVLTFEDPHKDQIGDEELVLEPLGKANMSKDPNSPADYRWVLYMPGTETIAVRGPGLQPIVKPQSELTAIDVAQMLCTKIVVGSNGRIQVRPTHVLEGISMIARRSESFIQRWDILEERLRFQRNLVKFPWLIAMILRSEVKAPPDVFSAFVQEMARGEIKSWTQFLQRIDQMAGQELVVGGGGAIVPLLLYQGLKTVPEPRGFDDLNTIPPSLLVSLPGLIFYNTVVDGYERVLQPLIKQIALGQTEVQEKALQYVNEFLAIEASGWVAASAQLRAGGPALRKAIGARVEEKLKELEKQMEEQIDGPAVRYPASSAAHDLLDGDLEINRLVGSDDDSSGRRLISSGRESLRPRGK